MLQEIPMSIYNEVPNEVIAAMNSIITKIIPSKKKKKQFITGHSTVKFMRENTPYSLKPHQKDGLKRLLKMEKVSPIKGGLLCDEPGMGKTIQIGALMKANPVNSNLIIVPVCVVNQWEAAMRNIFNPKNIVVHTGISRSKSWEELRIKRKTNGKDNMSNIIVITTYGIVTASKKTKDNLLYENEWGRVILDEGHYIRNSKTNIFKKVNRLKRTYSWILTGTPLQNKMADVRTLFKFTNPRKIPMPINDMISNNLLRRTKTHLENTSSKLDDYTITNCQCKFLSKEEQEVYLALHRNIMEDLGGEAALSFGDVSMEMLEQILRLRQASIHPDLALHSFCRKYDTDIWKETFKPSTKITKFIEKVKEVEGYSIAFCHFRAEMEMIKTELTKDGIESELYHGSMSSSERQAILAKFPIDRVSKKVLIIQIKAGGVGLNLQQFTSIFIISPDWNPSNEIQAIARAHRIGQNKKVKVFKFTTIINDRFLEECDKEMNIKTIDQIIINKQKLKRILMAEVLDDDTLEHNEVSLV